MTELKSMNFTLNSPQYPDPKSNFFTFEKKEKIVPGYNNRINRRRPGSYWQRLPVYFLHSVGQKKNSGFFFYFAQKLCPQTKLTKNSQSAFNFVQRSNDPQH